MFKMDTAVGGMICASVPLVVFNLHALGTDSTIYQGLSGKINMSFRGNQFQHVERHEHQHFSTCRQW